MSGADSRALRRGAGILETVATDADRAVGRVDDFAAALSGLPERIETTLAGTVTKVDRDMEKEFERAGRKMRDAIAALSHAASTARAEAERARMDADRMEREEAQARANQRSR